MAVKGVVNARGTSNATEISLLKGGTSDNTEGTVKAKGYF
jgi:hypothetical protein